MSDLNRVREALRASMTAWASVEVRGDQARVQPVPQLETLMPLLDHLDPHWSISWRCAGTQPFVVSARLSLLGLVREGLASGPTLEDAKQAALAEVARMYGVVPTGEGQWVEYDPEEGANTAELEAEATAAAPVALSALPPEPPRDPQMEKARRHIEELIEQIKAAGKGGEAARVLLRGYGETLEESRALYKELQGILKA